MTTSTSSGNEDTPKTPMKRKQSSSSSASIKSPKLTKLIDAPPQVIQSMDGTEKLLLFSLADNDELIEAKILSRPSKRNRSPYVADVWLQDEQREAIAHVPNLDMGGKCVPGAVILLRPARDAKGNKVTATAQSPKYGTPKCEFIAQLLYVDETGLTEDKDMYPPTWVGAHPSLGERIAETWLRNGLVPGIPPIQDIQTQVSSPCGTDMRCDFLLTHLDGTKRLVEVKTVVDTDYSHTAPPPASVKCRFLSETSPYTRTAIFPWGNGNQKGPQGEKVVSARAIKHIQELTRIANGHNEYEATVLFVVIRNDAAQFRPNAQACTSLCRYLRQAQNAGVQVLAKRVEWGTGNDRGKCFDDKMLPIEWPNLDEDKL